jgi:integral membrane sensor domain MASE1
VWPPSGIALAAVLMWGPRVWPGIAAGSVLVTKGGSGGEPDALARLLTASAAVPARSAGGRP